MRARAKADEERLQSELRLQVQLLEPAPRLPYELGGALGCRQPLGDTVLAQGLEMVEVDDDRLGADSDRDEIAVPRRQLLERFEHALPHRAELRPPQPLLVLPLRQAEPLGLFVRPRASLARRRVSDPDDGCGGLGGREPGSA